MCNITGGTSAELESFLQTASVDELRAAQHQQLAGWLQELFLLRQLVGKNSE